MTRVARSREGMGGEGRGEEIRESAEEERGIESGRCYLFAWCRDE